MLIESGNHVADEDWRNEWPRGIVNEHLLRPMGCERLQSEMPGLLPRGAPDRGCIHIQPARNLLEETFVSL